MNKILVLIIIGLLPVAIFTKYENKEVFKEKLETEKFELPIVNFNEESSSPKEVLVSNNKDKSDAFKIDLEDYIIGVVAGEMPASFSMEALKAQAVAARTFAVNKMETYHDYVLSTSVSDQVYITIDAMKSKWGNDFNYYYDRVKNAVLETEGQVVTYNGNPISAYYFAISNGSTDDASVVFKENKEYLVSVDSNWDKKYNVVSSSRVINKNSFCTSLNISCDVINISNVIRSDANYVRSITINGKTFTGLQVFNILGLKSTDFTITVNNNDVVINTMGFGHSVGMSQYGALGMAEAGYNYKDILTHYYKNTKIETI